MRVVTRSGKSEPLCLSKIQERLEKVLLDMDADSAAIDTDEIARAVVSGIHDGISTSEIDALSVKEAANRFGDNIDYLRFAARLMADSMHRDTLPTFSAKMLGPLRGALQEKVVWFVEEHAEELDAVPRYERDFEKSYFALHTIRRLLLRPHGQPLEAPPAERPQDMWLRVAVQLWYPDMDKIRETYGALSTGMYTHATPTLLNACTKDAQMASCFLLGVEDSCEGIMRAASDCAKISKHCGGIGVHFSGVRSAGAPIRGTGGRSNGTLPFIRVLDHTVRAFNQGGRRPGSMAVYLEPHHPDVLEFLSMRHRNKERIMVFPALWVSDLFMKRFTSGGKWTLFDPSEHPRLYNCWGEKFERRYEAAEAEYLAGRGKSMTRQIDPAEIVKAAFVSSQISGVPYVHFRDAVNRASNHKHLGTLRGSNLCAEIVQYATPDEYAVCNLASLCLPRFVRGSEEKWFDFPDLACAARALVRNLNRAINRNAYPLAKCSRSNMRHRPMGIGVQGLADVFLELGLAYGDPEALALDARIFETVYYAAVDESASEAARRPGAPGDEPRPHPSFEGSDLSEGVFHWEHFLDEPPPHHDWEALRARVVRDGVANSTFVAVMPTATTSQVMDNNECVEPYTTNLYTRKTSDGEFRVANRHLFAALRAAGVGDRDITDALMLSGGSAQGIPALSDAQKRLFRCAKELPQKTLLDHAAARAPFVDQSQSLNLYWYSAGSPQGISLHKYASALTYAWKRGLKTACYYTHTTEAVAAQGTSCRRDQKDCFSCSA